MKFVVSQTAFLSNASKFHAPFFVLLTRAQSLSKVTSMDELAIRRCSWVYEIGNRQSDEEKASIANDTPSPSFKPPAVERPGDLVQDCTDGRGHWTALVIESDSNCRLDDTS